MKSIACMILLLLPGLGPRPGAAEQSPPLEVLESRCLGCHDADTRKGGVDLEQLLSAPDPLDEKIAALWEKVDKAVGEGEMPPKKKKALTAAQKAQIAGWFEATYVLKDGKEHIGESRLRRLSRYELINTLEELLRVSLKQPYVYSPEFPAFLPSTLETILPPEAPGESGFYNGAA